MQDKIKQKILILEAQLSVLKEFLEDDVEKKKVNFKYSPKKCIVCGESFFPTHGGQKSCSKKCKQRRCVLRWKERHQKNKTLESKVQSLRNELTDK